MTYTVTIVQGRPKRDIVEMMREFCGQAGYEFELTADEVASDLRLLDTMMAEWPWNRMGYDPATYGSGLPEDPSGLSEEDIPAVFMHLAQRRCPGLGASLPPEGRAQMKKAYASACSRYATVPVMPHARNTVRGSGSRGMWRDPFINEVPPVDIDAGEDPGDLAGIVGAP